MKYDILYKSKKFIANIWLSPRALPLLRAYGYEVIPKK